MLTFGIITKIESNQQKEMLDNLVNSILNQSVKVDYEIIVVGNYINPNVKTINFSEDLNGTSYITRKQNRIIDEAKYEIIVFLRDYEKLWEDWVDGYLKWNRINKVEWSVMMTPVLNLDMTRYRDVCHWDMPDGRQWIQNEKWCPEGRLTEGKPHLPPYSDVDQRYMYINGGYFVVKKGFINNVRWDESLQWGQAEDVNISIRMREIDGFRYVFNPYSIIQLQKQKERILPVLPSEYFGSFEYIMSKYEAD